MTVTVRTLDELIRPPDAADSSLSTQEYFVNMGPQHPIAHGSLRLVLLLDGETVERVIPVPGYVHRGLEKMAEAMKHAVVAGRADLSGERILAFAAERLANFKRPKSVEVWPELPKSSANKIMRREVRDRILARAPAGPGQVQP